MYNYSVSKDIVSIGLNDPTGQQMKIVLNSLGNHCMSGIVPTLTPKAVKRRHMLLSNYKPTHGKALWISISVQIIRQNTTMPKPIFLHVAISLELLEK